MLQSTQRRDVSLLRIVDTDRQTHTGFFLLILLAASDSLISLLPGVLTVCGGTNEADISTLGKREGCASSPLLSGFGQNQQKPHTHTDTHTETLLWPALGGGGGSASNVLLLLTLVNRYRLAT
jgi:hypothetical protein